MNNLPEGPCSLNEEDPYIPDNENFNVPALENENQVDLEIPEVDNDQAPQNENQVNLEIPEVDNDQAPQNENQIDQEFENENPSELAAIQEQVTGDGHSLPVEELAEREPAAIQEQITGDGHSLPVEELARDAPLPNIHELKAATRAALKAHYISHITVPNVAGDAAAANVVAAASSVAGYAVGMPRVVRPRLCEGGSNSTQIVPSPTSSTYSLTSLGYNLSSFTHIGPTSSAYIPTSLGSSLSSCAQTGDEDVDLSLSLRSSSSIQQPSGTMSSSLFSASVGPVISIRSSASCIDQLRSSRRKFLEEQANIVSEMEMIHPNLVSSVAGVSEPVSASLRTLNV